MLKLTSLIVLAVLFADSFGQRFIHPTYRPPPQRPIIIRTVRDTGNQEPLWLYQGDNIPRAPSSADNGILPSIIDDVRFNPDKRYARDVYGHGSGRRSGAGIGTSHRFRRNFSPFMPRPSFPNPRPRDPFNPFPRPGPPRTPYPIYANH